MAGGGGVGTCQNLGVIRKVQQKEFVNRGETEAFEMNLRFEP